MTSHSWLESSLHRSSKLGREVLEKARKRSVRWLDSSPHDSRRLPEPTGEIRQSQDEKIREDPLSLQRNLDNAFDRIVECMDHASYECKKFYSAVPEPSNQEKEHICHFHSGGPARPSPLPPSTSSRKHLPVPAPVQDPVKARVTFLESGPEDFHIVLSPGSYAITAGIQGVSPQTQVVRVKPGESMNLTFNL